jgi:MOSC domain-containing protein YiiM
MTGSLAAIYISPTAAVLPHPVGHIRALAGRGLEGDRYATGCGTFSNRPGQRDVTLVEEEEIERFSRESGHPLDAALSRRNLLTRGVRLNELVGREFVVGTVRMRGLRLCEPCTHLERVTGLPVLAGLVHRGGLYAEILEDGEIKVGDRISVA